jgi:hypothetical protein
VSYSFTTTIPLDTPAENERPMIAEHVIQRIPEELTDTEWDFSIIKKTKTEKQILVFAPLKKIVTTLMSAAQKAHITIEAIEPLALTQKRHKDLHIGLALKNDISGTDENVMNVHPDYTEHTTHTNEPNDKNSSAQLSITHPDQKQKKMKLFVASTLAFITMSIATYTVFLSYSQTSPPIVAAPSPTIPAATETPTSPSPVAEREYSDYSIRILNGSGVPGAAGAVQELLQEEGFAQFDTDNADSFDFTDTEIRVGASASATLVEDLMTALEQNYIPIKKDPLTDISKYDIVIVVGTKKP